MLSKLVVLGCRNHYLVMYLAVYIAVHLVATVGARACIQVVVCMRLYEHVLGDDRHADSFNL